MLSSLNSLSREVLLAIQQNNHLCPLVRHTAFFAPCCHFSPALACAGTARCDFFTLFSLFSLFSLFCSLLAEKFLALCFLLLFHSLYWRRARFAFASHFLERFFKTHSTKSTTSIAINKKEVNYKINRA